MIEEKTKIQSIYPKNTFYQGTVSIVQNVDDKGKTKKVTETYLIDANDISDAEKILMSTLDSINGDWEITGISKSKVCGIVIGEK